MYNIAMDNPAGDDLKQLLDEVCSVAEDFAEHMPDMAPIEESVKDMDELLEEAGQALEQIQE